MGDGRGRAPLVWLGACICNWLAVYLYFCVSCSLSDPVSAVIISPLWGCVVGGGGSAMGGCKMSSARQLTMPNSINPKGTLGPSIIHSGPGANGGPETSGFLTHRPTRSKLTNISLVINAGRRNRVNFKSLLRLRRHSTFLQFSW